MPPLLPLTDDRAPIDLRQHLQPSEQRYVVQQHVTLDAHPGADVVLDQQIDVAVTVTPAGGGRAAVRATSTPTGWLSADLIDVVSQPLPTTPVVTRAVVDAAGAITEFEVDGAADPSGVMQQVLGGFAGAPVGWAPPARAVPGDTWDAPITLRLPVRRTVEDREVRGEIAIDGSNRWSFAGWSSVDGARCGVVESSGALTGRGAFVVMGPDGPVGGTTVGIAAELAAEGCWDPAAGRFVWHHAVLDAVQIAGGDDRVRMHVASWVGATE